MLNLFKRPTSLCFITRVPTSGRFRSLSTTDPRGQSGSELFLWKSEQQTRTFFEVCKTIYRVLNTSSAYRRFTEQDVGDKMELHHTISGSMWALKTSIAAIFQHKSMLDHFDSLKTKNKLKFEGPLMSSDVGSASFREIFDEKLAEFYTTAIEKHCAQSKNMVVYSLLKVDGAQFVDLELLFNIQRGGRMPRYDHIEIMKGVTMLLPPLNDDDDVEEHIEDITDQYLTEEKNSTVRAKVLVECSEIFAVTDVESGEIIHGSLEPRRVSHQLVFENYIDGRKSRLAGSWMIVDIDNWLQGNEFWTARKMQNVE